MKLKSLFITLFVLFMVYSSEAQSRREIRRAEREKRRTEMILKTDSLIDNMQFTFVARQALPQKGRNVSLTTGHYSLKFFPDSINSSLPFYGRAYNVSYGGDRGLFFSGNPDKYEVEKLKRDKGYLIKTTVKGDRDEYRLTLTVNYGGTANLTITSNNRASMSFFGDIQKNE